MKTIAFSIPIFKYKVQNWNIKKKKLLDLFNNLQHKVVGNVITSPIDIKTDILLEEVKIFEKEIGINFYSTEVWFQKYDINMNHAVHTHGPMGFSSVCFIEYDKDNHKPTTFISHFANYITGELERYKPDKFIIGSDYLGKEIIGQEFAKQIVIFDRLDKFSKKDILSYCNNNNR